MLVACAAGPRPCRSPSACAEGSECLANRCLPLGAEPVAPETRRVVLDPVAMAVVRTQRLIRQEDALLWALRASRERYDYAISGTNDGIFDWSLAAREFYVSPRFEELLGYPPGTLHETAATFIRRIHPGERRRALARFRVHLARGDPFDVELRLRLRDGQFRWFRTRGHAVLGERGKPQRIAGSLADISDRKQAEAQKPQQQKQNQQKPQQQQQPKQDKQQQQQQAQKQQQKPQ